MILLLLTDPRQDKKIIKCWCYDADFQMNQTPITSAFAFGDKDEGPMNTEYWNSSINTNILIK